jgi:TolB-like protein/tRNA A-37 threonylcarbamoyl transferase component Bud32/Flp pilus assembly protein TadD
MAPDSLQEQLQRALGAAYRVEREIGAGGMSTVFAGVEASLSRRVAIKVLQPELVAELSADRFAREVRLAASLQQANIVPLLSAGVAGGLSYYTMPLVDGSSLRARVASGATIPLAEAISILKDVARALAYAHGAGIVHRDIKPDNILLSGGTAVVSDFGIAKAMDAARTTGNTNTITSPGSSLGTPGYMAPEQVAGDVVDHRADIYAWGVVAWELLAARHPFASRTTRQAMLAAHLTEVPPAIHEHAAEVPPPLAALVMTCLNKDPDHRPQSAAELLAVLEAAATPTTAPARPNTSRKAVAAWAIAALGVVVLAAVALPKLRTSGSAPMVAAEVGASVAVLPFDNIGGDTAQEYFADGLTDELATALGRIPGLRVAARSAAYQYKGRRDIDVRQVGAELGVRYLLLGSVRRSGEQLRLSAQLTGSADAVEIWSESYSRPADDVLAVQDSLTTAITTALGERLGTAPASTSAASMTTRRGTTSHEAYDLYLKGHYYLNRRRPGLEGAVSAFEAAISQDPRFARAYAGIANALALLTYFGDRPLQEQRVIDYAGQALALDSTLADARVGLGIMHMAVGRFAVAENELRAAIAIEPQNAAAHFQLGRCLMYGRLDEAVEAYERAKSLEPYLATTATWLAFTLAYQSTPERALAEATRAWELDSSSAVVQIAAAMTTLDAGRPADALRIVRNSQTRNVMNRGAFAYVLGKVETPDSSRATIAEIEARGAANWNDHISLAMAALAIPDTTRALDALEKAYARGESATAWWPLWSRMFDSVRESPRFIALARRVGVESAAITPRR